MEQDVGVGLEPNAVRTAAAALLEGTIYADGAPIAFPRCVRVGEPIRVRSIERTSDISVFFRLAPGDDEAPGDWGLVEKSVLAAATAPGRRELAYEWALIFPSMAEQFEDLPTPEVDRRLALLPLRGKGTAVTTVVPNDVYLLDDPAILAGAPPVQASLQLTRLGERTEVTLQEDRSDFLLLGTWEVHGIPGMDGPIALRRGGQWSSHSAMVTGEIVWPERLELRFRPDPVADPDPSKDSVRTRDGLPLLRWNAPYTLTVRREPPPRRWSPDQPDASYRNE
jgi:hypothetical protein